MAKYSILMALFFVGGLGFPTSNHDGSGFDEDMSIFFDHTVTNLESRIVGGTLAPEGAYPWMVAMTNGIFQSFLCGGSVISNGHVLTAAHCIAAVVFGNSLSTTLRVRVGTNRWNSGGQIYELQSFRNHAQYNPSTIKNDIGILFTRNNIILSNRVTPIALNSAIVSGGIAARVSGWGRVRTGGAISANLLELHTVTVDGQVCVSEVARVSQELNIRTPAVDPNVEICTFTVVNEGACNGDSGSALVQNSNNAQIGIVSWGLPCARGAPDMFVRVSTYNDWINDVIG